MYGSDCNDHEGAGPKCQGAQTIAAVRRFAPNQKIERKLLYGNAKRLFRLLKFVFLAEFMGRNCRLTGWAGYLFYAPYFEHPANRRLSLPERK